MADCGNCLDIKRLSGNNKSMKKALILLILIIFSVVLVGCGEEEVTDYPAYIDGSRTYAEQALAEEQKLAYSSAKIENFFVAEDGHKVFRVISKYGYEGEIEMVILLNGSKVEKIAGINIKETPSHGGRCFNDKNLERYYGFDLKEKGKLTGKPTPLDEGDVVYVSGATVTSKAIIDGINAVALFINSQE